MELELEHSKDSKDSKESKPSKPKRPQLKNVQSDAHYQEHWEIFVKASRSSINLKLAEDKKLSTSQTCRLKLQEKLDSIWLQSFMLFLVAAEIVAALASIIKDERIRSYVTLDFTLAVILVYVLEIAARMYAFGAIKFFSSVLDVIDFVAVIGALLLLYLYSIYVVYALLVKILRWIRTAHAKYKALNSRTKKIQTAIRHLHHPNLRGYRDDKYDLDIAYITDHILMMSRPATSTVNQFSHDALSDVKSFLDEKHKGCYKIYDLCVYNDSGEEEHPSIVVHEEQYSRSAPSPEPVSSSMVESTGKHPASPSRSHDPDSGHTLRRPVPDSSHVTSRSYMSLRHLGADKTYSPQVEYDTFGDDICNDFGFLRCGVLPLKKLFQFAEDSTAYADKKQTNVIILQSRNGLRRCMFMCACLLFYYYPTASLVEIMRFIHSVRLLHHRTEENEDDDDEDEKETERDLFALFLPSQTRYLQYFATLILHCYRAASSNHEIDDQIEALERNMTEHIEQIQHHHHKQSMIDEDILHRFNEIEKSKWNFYHHHAEDLLYSKIGVVIKQIGVFNYREQIDPFVRYEADIFQWKEADEVDQDEHGRFTHVEYDSYTYGTDTAPGKTCSIIRRADHVKPRVMEQDFGIRIFKCVASRFDDHEDKPLKRKLKAQLILHAHFLNLDAEHKITFKKEEIDFAAKDVHHRHFPKDFHIVIEARILKRKQ